MIEEAIDRWSRTYPGDDAPAKEQMDWWFAHVGEVLVVTLMYLTVIAGRRLLGTSSQNAP